MPTIKKIHKNKGFTLVELLIVVLIIGVLAGILIGVINPQGIRKKARDAQRKADLKTIQTGLELYFSDNRVYPTSASWVQITGSDAVSTNLKSGKYLNNVPVDPISNKPNSSPCDDVQGLRYNYKSNNSYYYLTAIMEVETSAQDSLCKSLTSWDVNGCPSGSETVDAGVCYGVQNP